MKQLIFAQIRQAPARTLHNVVEAHPLEWDVFMRSRLDTIIKKMPSALGCNITDHTITVEEQGRGLRVTQEAAIESDPIWGFHFLCRLYTLPPDGVVRRRPRHAPTPEGFRLSARPLAPCRQTPESVELCP